MICLSLNSSRPILKMKKLATGILRACNHPPRGRAPLPCLFTRAANGWTYNSTSRLEHSSAREPTTGKKLRIRHTSPSPVKSTLRGNINKLLHKHGPLTPNDFLEASSLLNHLIIRKKPHTEESIETCFKIIEHVAKDENAKSTPLFHLNIRQINFLVKAWRTRYKADGNVMSPGEIAIRIERSAARLPPGCRYDDYTFSMILDAVIFKEDRYKAPEIAQTLFRILNEEYEKGNHSLKPDLPIYLQVMNAWASSGRDDAYERLLELVQQAKANNIEMDTSAWKSLLRYAFSTSSQKSIRTIYDVMRASGTDPDLLHKSSIGGSSPEKVQQEERKRRELYAREERVIAGGKSWRREWNSVIRDWLLADLPDSYEKAMSCVTKMKVKGLEPSLSIWNALLSYWVRKRAINTYEKIQEIMDLMRYDGVAPNRMTYKILLDHYINQKAVLSAEKIFEMMATAKSDALKPNPQSVHSMFTLYQRAKESDVVYRAQSLMDRVIGGEFEELKVDDVLFRVFIEVLLRHEAYDAVYLWFNKMEELNISASFEMCKQILTKGRFSLAPEQYEAVFYKMTKADKITVENVYDHNEEILSKCHITMQLWAQSDHPRSVERLLSVFHSLERGDFGVLPVTDSYQKVIYGLTQSKRVENIDKAEKIVNRLAESKLTYDVLKLLSFVASTWIREGFNHNGNRILDNMVRKHREANNVFHSRPYESIVGCFLMCHQPVHACKALQMLYGLRSDGLISRTTILTPLTTKVVEDLHQSGDPQKDELMELISGLEKESDDVENHTVFTKHTSK